MKLVADIGGTNARFALADATGQLSHMRHFANDAYADLQSVVHDYVVQTGVQPADITQAAMSVAMPVTGDVVRFTNRDWSFSQSALQAAMGWSHLEVINDFAAIALSLPHLTHDDCVCIGDAVTGDASAPLLVLGPGTGLGVALLVPTASGWLPVATEGGHVTLSAHDDRESEILRLARKSGLHVSAERLLSGMGLPMLHRLVCEVDGFGIEELTASEIGQAALYAQKESALRTWETFFAMLGSVAGNLALSAGARGGVFLAGGILPKMRVLFERSSFRHRFTEKGRFASYLGPIPTRLIIHENPALIGLAFEAGKGLKGRT